MPQDSQKTLSPSKNTHASKTNPPFQLSNLSGSISPHPRKLKFVNCTIFIHGSVSAGFYARIILSIDPPACHSSLCVRDKQIFNDSHMERVCCYVKTRACKTTSCKIVKVFELNVISIN